MKRTILHLLFALLLSACSLEQAFQGPADPDSAAEHDAKQREYEEKTMEARVSLPTVFSFDLHISEYDEPLVHFDESCRNTAPYLAKDGDKAYAGLTFKSNLLESNKISETQATSRFLISLLSVKIENYIVSIEDQTVSYYGEGEPAQVLDPQQWINRANEINTTLAKPIVVTVEYTNNPYFIPDNIDMFELKIHERYYWVAVSATCINQ